jgi:hypothetical protein
VATRTTCWPKHPLSNNILSLWEIGTRILEFLKDVAIPFHLIVRVVVVVERVHRPTRHRVVEAMKQERNVRVVSC